jgi:hypothetical protein
MSYDVPPQVQFSPPPSVPPPRGRRQQQSDRPDFDSPEARKHAAEAVAIRKLLNRMGIDPERVAPTADGRGHVRLNFADIRKMASRRNRG